MPRKKKLTKWEDRLGIWPLVVWYGERPEKGNVCYTRTWDTTKENWRWKSCRTKVRNADGSLDAEAQSRVVEMAKRRHDLLTGKVTDIPVEQMLPVRIRDAWAIMTGEGGRYPTKTTYRDELEAGLTLAAKVLGGDYAWIHMDEDAFTRVVRAKVKEARARRTKDGTLCGHNGFRSGVQAGTSILIIMSLLRQVKRLPANLALPGGHRWRERLKQFVTQLDGGVEPVVKRPRYSLDEYRRLFPAMEQVDPRAGLLYQLGAEIRLGQVRRARRAHLDLNRGIFTSPGAGGKKGTVQVLTNGQLAAIARALGPGGYLHALEQSALGDYPLFPQGRLHTEKADGIEHLVADITAHGAAAPIDKTTINQWIRAAELIAQIPHVAGRAGYGAKRRGVDATLAENASDDAVLAMGGWTSTEMPKTVYRDRDMMAAQAEASTIKAKIRDERSSAGGDVNGGENVPVSYPGTPNGPKQEDAS